MKKPYWERMDFKPELVGVVQEALASKLWRGEEPERLEKFRKLNRNMALACGVNEPELVLGQSDIGPHYQPMNRRIFLTKLSLVSWAHEFGHHLLQCGKQDQNEEFPRAFSLSLFRKAAPRMFDKAAREGKLLFTEAYQ